MVEYFYQTKKRDQKTPIAQLVGRTDFALFPVAGYLVHGSPDATALLFFLFFYPWTLAHLGANDIADIVNDRARGMATIPVLYGMKGAAAWVLGFSVVHVGMALIFGLALGPIALAGFAVGDRAPWYGKLPRPPGEERGRSDAGPPAHACNGDRLRRGDHRERRSLDLLSHLDDVEENPALCADVPEVPVLNIPVPPGEPDAFLVQRRDVCKPEVYRRALLRHDERPCIGGWTSHRKK